MGAVFLLIRDENPQEESGESSKGAWRLSRLGAKASLHLSHAVNAAIRRAGLEGKRRTNPVVDGQLVPRALKARGHGPEYLRDRKRGRHDESPAATPSTRARRPRRAAAN